MSDSNNASNLSSEQLFVGLTFYMRPCSIRSNMRILIEKYGGLFSRNIDPMSNILLTDALDHKSGYHIDFIHDSISKGELLDVEKYKLPTYRLKNGVVVDGKKTMVRIPTSSLNKARQQFIPEEDAVIFHYVTKFVGKDGQVGSIGGNMMWKEMERKQVTMHPWQSMKNRYFNHIKQHPPKFYFQPLEMGMSRGRFSSSITNAASVNISDISVEAPIIYPASSTPKHANTSKSLTQDLENRGRPLICDQVNSKDYQQVCNVTSALSSLSTASNQAGCSSCNKEIGDKNTHSEKIRNIIDIFKFVGSTLENASPSVSRSKLKEIIDIFQTAAVSLDRVTDDIPERLPEIIVMFRTVVSCLGLKVDSSTISSQVNCKKNTVTTTNNYAIQRTHSENIIVANTKPNYSSAGSQTNIKTPLQNSADFQEQSTSHDSSTKHSELISSISDWDFNTDTSILRGAVHKLQKVFSQAEPGCDTEEISSSIDMFQSVLCSQTQPEGNTGHENQETRTNKTPGNEQHIITNTTGNHTMTKNSTLLPLEPQRPCAEDIEDVDFDMALLREAERSSMHKSDSELCDCYEEYDFKAGEALLNKIETTVNDKSFLTALCDDLLLEEMAINYNLSVAEVKIMISNS